MPNTHLPITLLTLCLCLIFMAHTAMAENKNPKEPCGIFVPETKVRDVIQEHLNPYAKQYEDCLNGKKAILQQIEEQKGKQSSMQTEIDLIKKLMETVKAKVNQRHEEKEKVLQNLKDLLEKLKKPTEDVKKAIEDLNKKLDKQKAECDVINKNRTKYVDAIKNIDTAEGNMRRADEIIAKFEASKAAHSKKVDKFTKIVGRHQKTIDSKLKRKGSLSNKRDSCLKTKESLFEYTNKLKTCTAKLNPIKADYKKCSVARSSINKQNKSLKSSVNSLKKKVEILTGSNSKWKNLADKYKPKTITDENAEKEKQMEAPVAKYTGAHRVATASGDPHLMALNDDGTASKNRYNIYKQKGDFLMFRSPDNSFELRARMRYTKKWKTNSVMSALAFRADGNIIESHGGNNFKVDGKREVIAAGQTKTLKGGVTIKCSRRTKSVTTYTLQTPEGMVVTFSANILPEGVYYHSIALHAPVAWSKTGKGLLVFPVRSHEKVTSFRTDNKPGHHLFGTVYVPKHSDHMSTKVEWKNLALKKKAEDYCYHVLQRRDQLYNDCVLDAKISGDLDLVKGYAEQAEAVENLKKVDGDEKEQPLGRGYRILSRVLRAMTLRSAELKENNVVDRLKGEPAIQSKVSEIVKRLEKEIDTVRAVNAELGKRLAA